MAPVRYAAVDTTFDTTLPTTSRNTRQSQVKKTAYLRRLCNNQQRPETEVIGLGL
jgi:hypothetical protein